MFAECWTSTTEQRALILSPSLETVGGYRLTHWDHIGPSGHTEHDTLEMAREELTRQSGPWPGVPRLGIKARQAEYQLTKTEPTWLGLTVITSGIVEQRG